MKAVILQRPKKLIIGEVPGPSPSEYDALCEILACAVCGGTDNHIVHGHPYFKNKIKYPVILGHEAIGRVISCGKKVKYFKKGDLITRIINKLPRNSDYSLYHGAFAEKGIATDWQAMRDDGISEKIWQKYTINRVLPKDFDPIESTMIITWRETYSFLKRMNISKKETLLIIGSGANALAFADHCKNLNIQTIIIGNPERKKQFLNAAAKIVISYHEKNYIKILRKNGYKKIGAVIDTVGESQTLNKILPLLADKGKIGVYGLNDFPNYNLNSSLCQGDFLYFNGENYDESSSHNDIIRYIKERKLDAWDYLSKKHIYPLDKIEVALKAAEERKTIKSVIDFSYKNKNR